jgi:hypothetical protein
VAIESKSLLLRIDADARLAAAAGGAARHLADLAGIENGSISRLQSAVIAACLEVFEHLTADHPRLEIAFTFFPDRFEVALSHRGEGSPPVGLETIAGFDRAHHETHGGQSVTRLTKYIG